MSNISSTPKPLLIDRNPFLSNPEDMQRMKEETIIDPILLPINDEEEKSKPAKIFYYYHIFSRLGLDHSIMNNVQSTQGGNNVVYFSSSSPYLLRISRKNNKSLYTFKGSRLDTPYGKLFVGYTLPKNYHGRSERSHTSVLNTITKDEDNTLDASNNNLSPKLFYMGNMLCCDGKIYRFMIMEKYDMSLTDLLNITSTLPNEPLPDDDNTDDHLIPSKATIFYDKENGLAIQLTRLLDEIIDTLGIVCYDIKPANTVVKVINDDQGNFSHYLLKLIDWDSDFCKQEHFAYDKSITNFKEYLKFFNLLILGNFLHVKHQQNFLFDIVKERYKPELWQTWLYIFTNTNFEYSKHMIHYFYKDFNLNTPDKEELIQKLNDPTTTTEEEKINLKKKVEEHFNKTFINSTNFDNSTVNQIRSDTPIRMGRRRSQSNENLLRILEEDTQNTGGKSRKKRSRKRR
tara:strand:- start:553 stop:1926 length:1374 start_codon:yes stop_codon:yes gene_type:complete